MKRDVYQIITDRIIELLETGTIPWRKPWAGGDQLQQNLVSKKPYRGINLFLLDAARFPSPYWLSFRQVQLLGGTVKKGERSFPVVFWKIFKEEGVEDGTRIPFLRYYSVFNVAQCEGIQAPSVVLANRPQHERIGKCEKLVANMPKRPVIHHHSESACYSPTKDEIRMPEVVFFESTEEYYSTLFHELTHATGHVSRLNRTEITVPNTFGSDPYSREELVAEMGAAFLCGHCNIERKTLDNSAAYIGNWLERLKDDRKLVVLAAAQAQKACDFILDVKHEEEQGATGQQPKEYKVVALRDCPVPDSMQICDNPEIAAAYWRMHVESNPYFDPNRECLVILLLNTRRRVKGHHLVSIGSMDTILVHAAQVFRTAVIDGGTAAICLMHQHPSGDPTPSDADIKVTRDLIRAGQLLKIDVVDHVIIGGGGKHASLRALGYFYT